MKLGFIGCVAAGIVLSFLVASFGVYDVITQDGGSVSFDSSTTSTLTTIVTTSTTIPQPVINYEKLVVEYMDKIDNLTDKVVELEAKQDNKSFRVDGIAPANAINGGKYYNYSARPMGGWEWLYPMGEVRLYSLRCYLNETLEVQGKYAGRQRVVPVREIECDDICYYLENNPRSNDWGTASYLVDGVWYAEPSGFNNTLVHEINMTLFYGEECAGKNWRLD
jgi:hypothetical protein